MGSFVGVRFRVIVRWFFGEFVVFVAGTTDRGDSPLQLAVSDNARRMLSAIHSLYLRKIRGHAEERRASE